MYTEEKAKAKEFLNEHGNDPLVIETLNEIRSSGYSHSDRWSIVFDMVFDNYPKYRHVTTGLVYLVEDGEY